MHKGGIFSSLLYPDQMSNFSQIRENSLLETQSLIMILADIHFNIADVSLKSDQMFATHNGHPEAQDTWKRKSH